MLCLRWFRISNFSGEAGETQPAGERSFGCLPAPHRLHHPAHCGKLAQELIHLLDAGPAAAGDAAAAATVNQVGAAALERLAEIPVAQLRDLEHVFSVDRRARDCAGTWLARNAAAAVRHSLRITA